MGFLMGLPRRGAEWRQGVVKQKHLQTSQLELALYYSCVQPYHSTFSIPKSNYHLVFH